MFADQKRIELDGEKTTEFPILPKDLYGLYVVNFTSIPELPINLRELIIDKCTMASLPTPLPQSLEHLACYECTSLTCLPELPHYLNLLLLRNTQVTSLPELPEKLRHLYVYHNNIMYLPCLPQSLWFISCSESSLQWLPTLPEQCLRELNCSECTSLTCLPTLPKQFLRKLSCGGCKSLTCLPTLPQTLNMLFIGNCSNLINLPENIFQLMRRLEIFCFEGCLMENVIQIMLNRLLLRNDDTNAQSVHNKNIEKGFLSSLAKLLNKYPD